MPGLPRLIIAFSILLTLLIGLSGPAQAAPANPINHIVVIYMENHSFDNLYGLFPGANGISKARAKAREVAKDGTTFATLPPAINTTLKPAGPDTRFPPNLPNKPFNIDQYVPQNQNTGDLVHRFYQEQMQIDGGKMDKFAAISDAAGLTMGYYDTSKLPLYKYAKAYTLADNFFHAAFGGSFLNHFWLICACSPVWPNAPAGNIAQLDASGAMTKDGSVTPDGYAINTSFTVNSPHPPNITNTVQLVPQQTMPTIGDRLSEKGISWAWFSGGWTDALNGHPDRLFQFHHQPFAYFQNYADGTDGRKQHLKDESELYYDIQNNALPAVSFLKPLGEENEHPGYTDTAQGEMHAAQIVDLIQKSPAWQDTAIIITYDENGGFWDHVAPPKSDRWGPGVRVPTLIISPYAKKGFVDHTQYDTTSILKFIENRYGLTPLAARDANVNDLSNAFNFNQPPSGGSASIPSQLPNTGGSAPSLPLMLVGIGLLIALGSVLRRRARRV